MEVSSAEEDDWVWGITVSARRLIRKLKLLSLMQLSILKTFPISGTTSNLKSTKSSRISAKESPLFKEKSLSPMKR